MRAVVLYESVYGNTEAVARAIAEGLAPIGEVTLARFGDVLPGAVEEADRVVLGGPTHGWGMTRPASRQRPNAQGYAVGAREWLEGSPRGAGKMAAAFDTRFAKPRWLTGSAALRMARRLRRSGYRLVAPPESFFVLHTEGPLRGGGGGPSPTVGSGAGPASVGMNPQDYSRRAGLLAVIPFLVAQSQLDVGLGDLGVQINLWMHLLGSAAVIAIVLLPAAHDWVTRRL